ncbi:MAG: HDIG domain-containing protein [Prevotellaceae bacterium]|jgi:putative nucleotidyltransferase with HDIG domain|nr:HDIG domain-containing protein [Prevotellaceae bacterium]
MSRKINILQYRKAMISFFLASVAILFFMPGGGKFKYEFNQGELWLHEELNAPFDFPVYKSETELRDEYTRVSKLSLNYFVFDSLAVEKQLTLLKERIDRINRREFELLKEAFVTIYNRGIIDASKFPELKNKSIAIVRGNTYEETPVSELFTQTSANEYLHNAVRRYYDIDNLNLSQFIVPNLIFDETLTSKIRHKNLEAILPTEGMISEGVKIVAHGEQITPEVFKILASLKKEYEKSLAGGNRFLTILGRAFLVFCCMGCIFALLLTFRRTMLAENKCLVFIIILLTFFIILALQVLKVHPNLIYVIPFTIVPIYISSFFYSRPAIYLHFFMTLLIGSFVPASFEFVFINSIAGITAVIGFKRSYERGELFFTGLLILLVYITGYISLKLLHEGSLHDFTWYVPLLFLINSLLVIILYQFTFLFERLFGFVSISRLVELSNTNRKLLRDLTERAPGTAQHVMQVANIAEAVISAIGGDPLLVRAGAMYHDIGKMKNPAFFIENQPAGISPHDKISPEESARIIIEHVTYGVELAHKHHLPNAIIDFIKTHHGKSLVYFFYMKYMNEHPDDKDAVQKFTYPGPNPSSKEMVVVMMADSCEAASRSLSNPDETKLNDLVDKIIDRQHADGLFNDSNITLKEINAAKSVIKNKLKNIYHARIAYPK